MPGSDSEQNISHSEARRVLSILCIKYGLCLSPLWTARLEKNPPRSIEKFTETVFRAEGMDPVLGDTDLYKMVQAEVQLAFDRSGP